MLGIGPKGVTGNSTANGILAYLFDPANGSGFFGKNQGPGAFMNPNGQGGALYPGGPGLPGGNATGGALNDAAGVIAGGALAGPALAGGAGSAGTAGAAGAAGGGAAPAATAGTGAAASSSPFTLNNAAQLASIAKSMGVGQGGGQQAPSQLAQPPPRTPVQQGAAPAPPVANPQPQSPGALSQPQAGNSPQLKQLLAQLGITANA